MTTIKATVMAGNCGTLETARAYADACEAELQAYYPGADVTVDVSEHASGITPAPRCSDDVDPRTVRDLMGRVWDRMGSESAPADVHCECGEAMGEACEWSGPASDTVLVEYMPEQHRASHEAAGNAGTYPHNGAVRIRCERSCAERLVKYDGDWARIVEDRTAAPTPDPAAARKAIRELARQDESGETDDSYSRHHDAERAIREWEQSARDAGDRDLVAAIDALGIAEAARVYAEAREEE